MTTTAVLIRTARLEDEPDLIEICHITGNTRVEPYLFGLRWCLDYLWHDTENCFVAVDLRTNEVVGYIIGTLDSVAQVKRFNAVMLPRIKRHFKHIRNKTIHDFSFYLTNRFINQGALNESFAEYPAHLHINLLPEYQRGGIGGQLLSAYEDNLREKHIPGYHLGVAASNQGGISFYRKQGLDQLQNITKFGKPLALVFGRKLG
jgi:ribosomal protein S18 acetylase RimI-like enzyme